MATLLCCSCGALWLFLGTKLADIGSTVDGELATTHAELQAKPNSEARQLLNDAHANSTLKQQVSDLTATAEEQEARLKAALEAAKEKEAAAKAFAEAANAFAAQIKAVHASLAAIAGTPEERKSAIGDIQVDVDARAVDVEKCRTLDETCRSLGVTSNTFTTETQHSVEALYEALVKLVASMLNEIEGQIAAASAGKLDPDTIKYVDTSKTFFLALLACVSCAAQIVLYGVVFGWCMGWCWDHGRSLNKLFKEFDSDGSGLGFQEFYECCNACGLVIDEKKAKKLFSP